MAGESPDRSKQRESSAEPTSGSAGSVPEARDPRLAVAAEKETAGGVDTATRVFSVRDPKPAGEDDTKLRAAVAAWVRTSDENPEEPADGDPEGAAGPEAAEEGPEKGSEGPQEGRETPEPSEAPETPDTAPEATTGSKETAPSETPEPEDARPAAAPEATNAPEDAPEPEAADAEGKLKPTAEPEDAKPQVEPQPTADPTDAKPANQDETDAEPEDARPADQDGAKAEPEDAEPRDDSQATTEPEDAGPEDAEPADQDGADAEPEDAKPAKPANQDETDAHPEDAKPADQDDVKAEPADAEPADQGGADGEDGPQGSASADNDGRGAAVDQPTTTLKAPRATRPSQVDQPTTMLKLGGTPKPKTGEGDAERTSKFVALKSDIKPDIKPVATPEAKPGAKPEAKPGAAPTGRPETDSATRTTVIPQVGPERTTQQPLPPKPPLDLLAELTNTPRPPETPVRTAIRRVKIWTPLVIVLLIIFAVVQNFRPLPQPTLGLTAKDTYTFDGGKVDIPWPAEGQAALDVQGIGSFGSSGAQKPVPIASVAKVMTAYIILRDHPLKSGAAGPKIKIDQAAQDQANAGQESTVDVTAGDSITQREALESILIASANNVARLLARWDAGSEKSFVAKMNTTAKQLGMTNTTYTDPSGLTNSTVSTAVDQVKLAKAAMASEPVFREVAAMMSYDDYKGVNHGNWNQLVGHNNVVGIKTGTTTSALGNLVFAAKKDVNGETRTVIGAVIRQPANAGNGNSILKAALNAGDQLIQAAQGALKAATIYQKGAVVGYVDDGLGGRTPVVATKDVTAVGWSGLKVKLTFAADDVPHTAKAGTKVGTLTVGDGSGSAVQVPVALQKDLAEPGFTSRLTRLG
ncbi:D-alanyl-D-alanine carboxypeptidase [Streptomyces arenae]|nr:D-alanyl-D-alanine carboxypeptidase [Streptomyces arenae]MCG7210606.1 D-alanyl-D-alanine carboxypeptidase [Streptomyces arenae]